jgi:hypothetical protein
LVGSPGASLPSAYFVAKPKTNVRWICGIGAFHVLLAVMLVIGLRRATLGFV